MKRRVWTRWTGLATLLVLVVSGGLVWAEQPAENGTRVFLGEQSEWEGVAIVVQQSSPLFGGREFYVSGAGRIVIVDVRRNREPGVQERRFELTDAMEETNALIEKVIQANLLEATLERSDRPRPTCSGSPLFILRNADGQIRSLPLIAGAPTEAYDDVLHEVASLMRLTRGKKPVCEGRYDTAYVPESFAWTAEILAPGKDIRWAPQAAEADIARAEQEYSRKVQVQLEAIAKKQAQAHASGKEGQEQD